MENNTQENLIVKKTGLLSTLKNVGKRSLIALMLATMLANTPACKPRDDYEPNTNENGNENENNNGNQNGNNQNNQSQDKYSKCSQILRNVMEDKDGYYSTLISMSESASYDHEFNNPKYQAIPYGFLEDKNYDIDKIKNKELYSYSEMYSIGNDLYIELKVEVSASTNYLDCYLLKYSLTDKELSELKSLFTEQYSNSGDATFYQAPFFIQEMSYLKDPEVLSLAHTTKSTDDGAIANCDKRKLLGNGHNVLYLGSTYLNDPDIAYHTYQIRIKTAPASCNSKLATLTLGTHTHGILSVNDLKIHNYEDFSNGGILTAENKEKFESSIIDIVSYTSRAHYFIDINNKFESIFSN